MTNVLVTLPKEVVEQVDILASYYCKSRLAFLREFIAQGLITATENYANRLRDLEDANRIFQEMECKAIERDAAQGEKKLRWEDSY